MGGCIWPPKGDRMKETIYRCNKCHQLILDTRHKLVAQNEAGKMTKYGALLEDIDLCEECMASVSLSILDLVGEGETVSDQRQQDPEDHKELQETTNDRKEDQTEPTRDAPEKKTYQCSKVIKTCKYADKAGTSLYCNYLGEAKHRRECEPEECDKYEKVVRKREPKAKVQERE